MCLGYMFAVHVILKTQDACISPAQILKNAQLLFSLLPISVRQNLVSSIYLHKAWWSYFTSHIRSFIVSILMSHTVQFNGIMPCKNIEKTSIDICLNKCWVLLPQLLFSQLVDLMLGLILKYLTKNRLRWTVDRLCPLCDFFTSLWQDKLGMTCLSVGLVL